ncbi:MAG: hypothetical protein JJE44_06770 [Flavobacteriaceae bacterium]|nr:hypothetical protein [Flavobacteriaceae bacterium]
MKRTIIFLITVLIIALSVRFPHLMLNPGELTKGHQKIKNDCAACHKPFWGIEARRCVSCHKIDEIGRNDSLKSNLAENNERVLFHSKLKNQECTNCHTDHKGIYLQMSFNHFDHEQLSVDMKTDCNSCHEKPADKLHDQLSVSCSSCHNTTNWNFTGSFDHDMITGVNKTNCTSCHLKPTDSFHQSLTDNCNKCHTTNKWVPSTFDHSPYFILDKDHNAECATCHTNNNYSAYTCYDCHEHSENKIIRKHQKHGIYNFSDCASCHPSGDEHDIREYDGRKREINQNDVNEVKEYIKSIKNHEKDKDDD